MDVLAHVGHVGNDVQCLVAHVLGVRRSKAHTHTRSSFGYLAQQHRESHYLPVGALETVRIDVLPQQGHFLVAFLLQVGHLAQDAFHIAAAFAAPRIGNYAVSTEVIASAHDGHKT